MSMSADAYHASIARARAHFVEATSEHEMMIILDADLHRHVRFQKPGSSIYYFDLVTWPGYLAIVGDCGDYLFCREQDMFGFFAPSGARGGFEDERWGINPGYWAEKLQAPRSTGSEASEVFSIDAYQAHVREWLLERENEILPPDPEDGDRVERTGHGTAADVQAYLDHIEYDYSERDIQRVIDLREAVEFELLDSFDGPHSEESAIRMLSEFEHQDAGFYGRSQTIRFEEPWLLNMRELDSRFLFCCWAIVWGIDQYTAAGVAAHA